MCSEASDGTRQPCKNARFQAAPAASPARHVGRRGQLALLLAVDPAAPDGDRLVGYQLVHGSVDSAAVEQFLVQLWAAGITPDAVITDGSALYPAVLAKRWPLAAHQRCLFHEIRRVTRAAMEVMQALRRTLPQPLAKPGHLWGGPLNMTPPTDHPDAPDDQRGQLRQATRQAGIAAVHQFSGSQRQTRFLPPDLAW